MCVPVHVCVPAHVCACAWYVYVLESTFAGIPQVLMRKVVMEELSDILDRNEAGEPMKQVKGVKLADYVKTLQVGRPWLLLRGLIEDCGVARRGPRHQRQLRLFAETRFSHQAVRGGGVTGPDIPGVIRESTRGVDGFQGEGFSAADMAQCF